MPRRWPAVLLLGALAAAGCDNPFAGLEVASVHGYMAGDLLPADRGVGSWRRPAGRAGGPKALRTADFEAAFGEESWKRARHWGLGESVRAEYRLGETGRTLTLEIYDLNKPLGAFDVYSFIRENAFRGGPARAKATKVGAQGLLSGMEFGGVHADGDFTRKRLLFWAERFLVLVRHEVSPGSDGADNAAEAALLAFGNAVAAKTRRPFELPGAAALQTAGAEPNSERYEPGKLFGRRELSGGFTARWQGDSGSGTLFLHEAGSADDAVSEFRRLRKAAGAPEVAGFADGLFVGEVPGAGPTVCFRSGAVLAGLVGAAEARERLGAVDELRRRLAPEPEPAAARSEASAP